MAIASVDCDLPGDTASVSRARRMVREALAGTDHEGWLDAAQLAVSELVTNAVLHTGTGVDFRLRLDADSLRVEIGDGSPHPPARRDYSTVSGTGRGLHMVSASVDDWGHYDRPPGKVVWFELRSPAAAPHGCEPDRTGRVENVEPSMVAVLLHNVPLLMHAAWQEHASTLIREYLLARLDEDPGVLVRHAQANDAMAVLYAQIPVPQLLEDAEQIMATAVEPAMTAAEVHVRLPAESVPDFHVLHTILDDAAELARAGRLLSPPAQPEVHQMRVWLCQQVIDQAAGGVARPWTDPVNRVADDDGYTVANVRQHYGRELVLVTESARPRVAADEHGYIVAVSRTALALLRYTAAGQLLDRRLICLVPERYRQAHIAGMTLYMTNGRDPLLGSPVEVPMLRSDGTETLARLTVEAISGDGHHRLFVGHFEEAEPSRLPDLDSTTKPSQRPLA